MRPRDIPAALAVQPFTVAAARQAGVSWKVLQGRFCSPTRGAYATAGTAATLMGRILVALAVLPPATLATWPRQVRRRGIKVTRVSVLPPIRGLAATSEHCWIVAALELNLLELVTAGDWLLRLKLTSPAALAAYVTARSSRGSAVARSALDLVRARVDSPRETWLRLCLVLAGLPEPECNPTIKGLRRSGRVDLLFRTFRVIVEYEGDQHRTDSKQWHKDVDRGEDFGGAGYLTVRVTKKHARRPTLVVRRVHDALRSRGYSGPAPTFDQRWMALFAR